MRKLEIGERVWLLCPMTEIRERIVTICGEHKDADGRTMEGVYDIEDGSCYAACWFEPIGEPTYSEKIRNWEMQKPTKVFC